MQQNSKIRSQFAVSIRRKQISQKLQTLRSQYQLQTYQSQTNYQKYVPIIQQILTKYKSIQLCLRQLKILSYTAQPAALLFNNKIHHKLYEYVIEKAAQITTTQYSDILTILINLCVHVQLDIPSPIIQYIASNILKKQHQILSIWFIANIIYQKSTFSGLIAKQLIQKCQVIQYMNKRIQGYFINQGDIVIFHYFCCSFLVVSGIIPAEKVKQIYKIIIQISKDQNKSQQNFWYLSQALIDHGYYIGNAQYQLFKTQILKKFQYYCKTKKTKYIKNYLKMLISFTSIDKQSYQKLLKYQIFTHLNYCLQNRYPQLKKLCADIGYNILFNFGQKVDIENIIFFQQLTLQIINLQKYQIDIQLALLKYFNKYFIISAMNCTTKQSKNKFIGQIVNINIIKILTNIINNNINIHNMQIIAQCLYLLQIFIKIDQNGYIVRKCWEEKLIEILENYSVNGNVENNQSMKNQSIGGDNRYKYYEQICGFLNYFQNYRDGRNMGTMGI